MTVQLKKPRPKAEQALQFAQEAEAPVITKVAKSVGKNTLGRSAPDGYRRLTINLKKEVHKLLRLKALEQNTTATEIIERLLEKNI